MFPRHWRRSIAALVVSALGAAPAAADRSPAGADAVRFWNEVTVTALVGGAVAVPEQPVYLT